jgi:hypothetical protein
VIVGLAIMAAYAGRIRGGMVDFEVNYRAGQRLAAGETLYQRADGHFMFKYLPVSALIYLPLTYLPLEAAKATWFIAMLLAVAWSFALVRELVPRPHRRYVFVISGIVLAKYFLHELRLGQINVLLMTVVLLATRALSQEPGRRAEWTAGSLAGLATAMKPNAALLLPYLLVRRLWRGAAAGACVLGVALVIPAIFYGVAGNIDVLRQWAVTLSESTPALLTNADNVSVLAFFAKWLGDPTRAVICSVVILAMLALVMLAVILRGGHDRRAIVLECAMLLTLVPLVSPLGWDYTFLASLLAVALIVNAWDAFGRVAQTALFVNFAVIAFSVYDLMGRRAYGTFMRWSVTTVNFIIAVIALAHLRFRGRL